VPLSAPRRPLRRPPPPRGFSALWRWFLPAAIALMVFALIDGIADPDAGPAWLFIAGIGLAVIGATSFLRHLWETGRRDPYHRDDPASRGPGR